MIVLLRCIKSDFYKLKHTFILWLHLIIPMAVVLMFWGYYASVGVPSISKVNGYIETLAIAFPFMIGLMASMVIEQEEQAGDFQVLLCSIKSKVITYLSKLILLFLLGSVSIALAVGTFALVYKTVPPIFYLKVVVALLIGNLFLYILHIFISLQFGMGASVGLGVAESLVSALMITGLGNGRWQWIPCAWGVRFCDYITIKIADPSLFAFASSEMHKGFLVLIPVTCLSLLASLFWFKNWEGRKSND